MEYKCKKERYLFDISKERIKFKNDWRIREGGEGKKEREQQCKWKIINLEKSSARVGRRKRESLSKVLRQRGVRMWTYTQFMLIDLSVKRIILCLRHRKGRKRERTNMVAKIRDKEEKERHTHKEGRRKKELLKLKDSVRRSM